MRYRIATIPLLGLALAGCGRAPAVEDGGGAAPGAPAASRAAAPSLEGVTDGGGRFTLAGLRGAPVVLIFYRGAFCGICVERLAAAQRYRADYEAAGAKLVAVTPEPADSLPGTRKRLDIDFPLVSVPPATLQRWGVWREGEPAPRPAEFVVDGRGAVRFGHVGRTAADRVSDETLLAVVRALGQATAAAR